MDKAKTVNRHIAKLLSRISVLQIPEIGISEIKRQMWFLADDLTSKSEKTENVNNG